MRLMNSRRLVRTGGATGPQMRQGLLSFAAGGELSHTSAGELLPRQQRGRSDAWLRYTGRLPQTIAGVLQPRAPLPTPWESLPKLCRLQNASIYAALASSTGIFAPYCCKLCSQIEQLLPEPILLLYATIRKAGPVSTVVTTAHSCTAVEQNCTGAPQRAKQ